jgi:signal transduction histidine kinase
MKIGTRLIVVLTISVSIVMIIASLLALQQREKTLTSAARNELSAHALTLRIALEEDFLRGGTFDAQRLIDRLRENTEIYSIILFDPEGRIARVSNLVTPDEIRFQGEARRAIATGETISIDRNMNGEDYFAVVMPLTGEGKNYGAIEVIQPISFVRSLIATERRDISLTAMLLCITILLVVYIVTRFGLSLPIQELLGGAQAMGQGDLGYRVIVPGGGSELTRLAQEFNRMADSLLEQRELARQQAEARLSLERKLRHTERLAVVGRLAAGVAHEMGAPLQVIDGRAKQLQQHPEASKETRERNLGLIRTQAERIANIVRQLLTLSRPYNLRLEPVNLSRTVASALEMIEIDAERAGVRIELTPDHESEVEADPRLLHQVFLNICRNAIQAMPDGGMLSVDCSADAFQKDGADFATVRFADTGQGIALEHLANIFDPFFTTKEVGAGTGLGLAVSSRIVEEHGGWIEAANQGTEDGSKGAVFTVYLPAYRSPSLGGKHG